MKRLSSGSRFAVVLTLTGALVAGAVAVEAQDTAPLPLEGLVERVQARYREITDLSARLRQVNTARPGMPPRIEEGAWFVRTPGLLRVEYERSDRLFVAAREAIYWYLPEDNQVQIIDAEALDPTYTPTLYLAGAGDLLEDFRVSGARWQEPLAPGNIQLRLDPVKQTANFAYLILEVEPETALIARLVQFGLMGESTDYQFHDIQTDVGLDEELFEFTIPSGTQVEHIAAAGGPSDTAPRLRGP